MAFDFGEALNGILDKGLDAWVDTEKARNFKAGAQTVGQRDAMGGSIPAGQPSATVLPQWASSPAVQIGAVLVGVLLLAVLLKKL